MAEIQQKFRSLIMLGIVLCLQFPSIGLSNSNASLKLKVNNDFKSSFESQNIISDFNCLELEIDSLLEINQKKYGNVVMTIELEDKKTLSFRLSEAKIYSDNFVVRLSDGNHLEYNKPLFYHGKSYEPDAAMVSLTIFDSSFSAVIMTSKGNIIITRAKNVLKDSKTHIYKMYNDKDFLNDEDFICGTVGNDNDDRFFIDKGIHHPEILQQTLSCIDIGVYFECDYHCYYTFDYNANDLVNYVSLLFGSVQQIYLNEDINLHIDEIFVWTTQDDYDYGSGDVNQLLNNVLYDFKSKRPYFNGHIAQLLSTSTNASTNPVGIAYLLDNGLCSNYDLNLWRYSYAKIWSSNYEEYPNYTRSIKVIAHEFGHNLGSRHTHWCGWDGGPIDNCAPVEPKDGCQPGPTPPANGGTIMSYCDHDGQPGIDFLNGFGELPGNRIRQSIFDSRLCLASKYFQNESVTNTEEIIYETPVNIYAGYNVTSSKPLGNYTVHFIDVAEYGNVVFKAGNAVILKNGFTSEAGSEFTAKIDNTLNCFEEIFPSIRNTNGLEDLEHKGFVALKSDSESFAESNNNKLLLHVHPNPSNAELTISYFIPSNSKVKLSIDNIFGMESVLILNNKTQIFGSHTTSFDCSALPTGIYFLTLRTEAGAVTRQFAVVR